MDLASSVDTETWRAVMNGLYELICDEVHRFDGTVNKFTGDGAMALFGAPIAHEDHAARACYAALHMRDRLREHAAAVRRDHGLSFSVRMGLNSGEVVVGAMGSDLDLDFTAIGNTVGLAARMEALAEPGRPCMTAATAALIEGYFELDDLGEVAVKGVSEPVHTFALLGTGTAQDAAGRIAGAGAVPVRRSRRRAGDARGGAGGSQGRRPGRRGGGRSRAREEPAVRRVRGGLPPPRDRRDRGPRCRPRQAHPAAAGDRDDAGLLRRRRGRRRPRRAREDRRAPAAAGRELPGRAAGGVRLPRRARSRQATARADEPGGAPARAVRRGSPPGRGARGSGARRAPGGGPPLARPRERGLPGEPGGVAARIAHPAGRELPAGVPRGLDAEVLLPAAAAAAPRRRGDRRAHPRPAGRRPLPRRPRRPAGGPDGRQSVLHRGGRPGSGRVGRARRRARRLPADPLGRRDRDPRDGAGRAGRAHRPAAPAREDRAPERVCDRPRVRRARAARGDRPAGARACREPGHAAGRGARLREDLLPGRRVRVQASADRGGGLPLPARRAARARPRRRGGRDRGAVSRPARRARRASGQPLGAGARPARGRPLERARRRLGGPAPPGGRAEPLAPGARAAVRGGGLGGGAGPSLRLLPLDPPAGLALRIGGA